jgi:hypothetical protein
MPPLFNVLPSIHDYVKQTGFPFFDWAFSLYFWVFISILISAVLIVMYVPIAPIPNSSNRKSHL